MGRIQTCSNRSYRSKIKEFYDNLANSGNYRVMYDRKKIWGRLKLEQLSWLEENLQELAGGIALDIGCGPGPHIPLLLKKGAGQLVELDISINMLKTINLTDCKDKVDLLCADLLNLPIKPSSVNCVLCLDTLHHLNEIDRERAIKTLINVLTEGSRIYLDIKNSRNLVLNFRYRRREDSYLPISAISPRNLRKRISSFGVIEREGGIGFPLKAVAPWIVYKIKKEKRR